MINYVQHNVYFYLFHLFIPRIDRYYNSAIGMKGIIPCRKASVVLLMGLKMAWCFSRHLVLLSSTGCRFEIFLISHTLSLSITLQYDSTCIVQNCPSSFTASQAWRLRNIVLLSWGTLRPWIKLLEHKNASNTSSLQEPSSPKMQESKVYFICRSIHDRSMHST